MFFRKITTRSNGREYTYVKLIENYRKGNKVKQRVIANLGNIEDLDPARVRGLIFSLSKVCGLEPSDKPKPKTKRVLRFGDVLLIHKIWEQLGLNEAEGVLKGPVPGMSFLMELLVIEKLLQLPPGILSDWRRYLYLPVPDQTSHPPLGEVLNCLAENKERLETFLFSRLQKWGKVKSPAYCYLLKGFLEENPCNQTHFLSRPPKRRPFCLDILATPEGLPLSCAVSPGNSGDLPDITQKATHAREKYHNLKIILVGNYSTLPEETQNVLQAKEQEYIAGIPLPKAKAQQFNLPGLLSALPDTFSPLYADLWYKEATEENIRYLICANPLAASRKIILKTNVQNLSCPEIIRIYNDFAGLQKRYRTIKCFFPYPGEEAREVEIKGQVLILWLTHLIEKLCELLLREQGVNLNAAAALQILEPVKIVIYEAGGEVSTSAAGMDKIQQKILSAVGGK